jgi:hypothetical protein
MPGVNPPPIPHCVKPWKPKLYTVHHNAVVQPWYWYECIATLLWLWLQLDSIISWDE